MPPSFSKCGVLSGCQSWVYTTVAPACLARSISRFTTGTTCSPPLTYRLPAGSAKSFWTSTTTSAARGSYCAMSQPSWRERVVTTLPLGVVSAQAGAGHELVVEVLAGATQQARDLHLRAADQRADLALLQVVEVVEDHHRPLRGGQARDQLGQYDPFLQVVAGRGVGEELAQRRRPRLTGSVEREQGAVLHGRDGLQDLLLGQVDLASELLRPGPAVVATGDPAERPRQPQHVLLHGPRHAHLPGRVAQVALELADDGGDGEGRERHTTIRIIAVDRGDQPDPRRLPQVVIGGVMAVAIARREPVGQAQGGEDHALAQRGVAPFRVLPQPCRHLVAHTHHIGAPASRLYHRSSCSVCQVSSSSVRPLKVLPSITKPPSSGSSAPRWRLLSQPWRRPWPHSAASTTRSRVWRGLTLIHPAPRRPAS